MRTSELLALAALLLVPAAVATGCLDSGSCLRNSDCPSADICQVGACVLAPVDSTGEGGVDEAGADTGASVADSATTKTDTGASQTDAGLADANADGDASDAAIDGDASDPDAADAGG